VIFSEIPQKTVYHKVRFYTGVTDNRWFRNLAVQSNVDEVNFWHPNGSPPFSGAAEGTPFLFKLKSPNHHIAGGGYLVKYESLPLRLAWDAFGTKNGASSFQEFADLIASARGKNANLAKDIGCSILTEPFFFETRDWIPMSDNFAGSVVRGKFFDTNEREGERLWHAVERALQVSNPAAQFVAERPVRHSIAALVRRRLGQGAFRALVTNAYGRRCAITGESTLPVLEAAHIRPVTAEGSHNTYNGLLLRSDFHKLFDVGLITVTPEHRVEVSSKIKDQWFNGKAYNSLHGEHLVCLPNLRDDQPHPELLRWHNEHVYEKEPMSA